MTDARDYPSVPIGKGNPYYCCAYCKTPDPEINGILENHPTWCLYRKMKEYQIENDWVKYLLKMIIDSLPQNRDWLDPVIEVAAKDILK